MQINLNPARPDQLIHYYNFSEARILLKEDCYKDRWGDTWKTIRGARKSHLEKACQMTITDVQLSRYDNSTEIKDYLKSEGFKTISAHKNPNTGRIIYTFMAPPLGNLSPDRKHRRSYDETYYTQLATARVEATGNPRIGAGSHGGGCCGVSTIVGLESYKTGNSLAEHLSTLLGTIFTHSNLGSLNQTILSQDELGQDLDFEYYLRRIGFASLYEWTNPITKEVFGIYALCTSCEPIPKDLQF